MPTSMFRKTYHKILDIIRVQRLVWILQKAKLSASTHEQTLRGKYVLETSNPGSYRGKLIENKNMAARMESDRVN